jgi:hypothetical protein
MLEVLACTMLQARVLAVIIVYNIYLDAREDKLNKEKHVKNPIDFFLSFTAILPNRY